MSQAPRPVARPTAAAPRRTTPPSAACAGTGKIGWGDSRPASARTMRRPSAVAAARPMSTMERGFHSKAKSSTPKSVAATGVPKTALMPAAGTGHEERAALGRGEPEELADDGADGTAGQDDRPLCAEGPTRADADRARDRFEERQARLHAAAVDEDALHRLGDAVTADLLRTEPRHEPHHQTTEHGDRHRQQPELVPGGRHQRDAEALVVEQVRQEADHVQQRQRDAGRQHADEDGGRDQAQDGRRRGEVPQGALGGRPGGSGGTASAASAAFRLRAGPGPRPDPGTRPRHPHFPS